MDQIRKLISRLTLRQQISIGVALVAVGLGLWAMSRWSRERDFRPLYSNLAAEDAGAVMRKLKDENVDFRVDDSGGTLRVPSEKVAELRLRMASEGLPKTSRIGFELFDKSNFGLTEFAEQVNYRRAIEGELERSITALSEIERARVHISLPKDSVFLESRQEAKASVVVSLRPRARLSPQNGAAITYLVASAVDRLAPEAVSVLDTNGNLLVRPRKASAEAGAGQPEADLEYRQKMERDLLLKINSTLEPLLGAEKFRAGVSVEVDFTTADQSEETFDPSRSAMVTAQKTEDLSGGALQAGVPGTASNLPGPPARPSASSTGTTRRTENTSYQTSRTVRRTRIPQGAVKRMSLAVLLDQGVRWEGKGSKARRILEPPSPERLKTIRELVAAATGFQENRGDQLTVETLAFESTLGVEPPAEAPAAPAPQPVTVPPWIQKYLEKAPLGLKIGAGAAAALILIGPMVAFLLLRRKRRKKAAAAEMQKTLDKGVNPAETFEGQIASRAANQERLDAEALLALKLPPPGTKKSEILTKHLKKTAKSDPTVAAQLLRTWINESESS
ncbi:MAG TPA: flagellar basal-body MS-ring/collar protein FliF [Bryobacteraceae bacterium]|jgi:flagellar M-ring protein FliF|nr:flagellar basal-body MS-ring/collar protein FliF [Bryobacteraceae bacterium]